MKYPVVSILLLCIPFLLFGQSVDSVVEGLISEMTLSYKEEHPDLALKPNMAVVPVEDQSPNARKYEVGPAITAILESKIERSIIFSLVNDSLRDKMLSEIKFSLSGLTEGDPLDPGNIAAIDYFLTGSISELGSDFLLSLRLIDVESGEVIEATEGTIPKDEVFQASNEYAAAYVSPYGIGIELSIIPWYYLYGDMADVEGQPAEGESGLFTVALNYRVRKWLVVWGSFSLSPGGQRLENTYETNNEYAASDMHNIDDTAALDTALAGSGLSYSKDRTPFMIMSLGGGYVFNITREFNISLGAELSVTQTFIEQTYYMPTTDNDQVNSYTIRSNDIALFSVTPKIKLQYFITPRLAVHVDYGFRYQFYEDDASQYFFRDTEYDTIPELFGLVPSRDPEGRNHLTDYTGHNLAIGLGFYF
jgi:TolB-like protein